MTLQDVLSDVGLDNNVFMRAFDDMAMAEEEIRRAKQMYPRQCEDMDKAFILLMRSDALKSEELYRRHMRELLKRVVDGQDCRLATKAEVLASLSEFSLQAVMNKAGSLVMAQLMETVMSDLDGVSDIVAGLRLSAGREDYAGQTREDITRLQQKVTMKNRVFKR